MVSPGAKGVGWLSIKNIASWRFWCSRHIQSRCKSVRNLVWCPRGWVNASFEPQPPKNAGKAGPGIRMWKESIFESNGRHFGHQDRCSFWHFPSAFDPLLAGHSESGWKVKWCPPWWFRHKMALLKFMKYWHSPILVRWHPSFAFICMELHDQLQITTYTVSTFGIRYRYTWYNQVCVIIVLLVDHVDVWSNTEEEIHSSRDSGIARGSGIHWRLRCLLRGTWSDDTFSQPLEVW